MSPHPAGFRLLLTEIGVPAGRSRIWAGVALIALFEISFIALGCGQAGIEYLLGIPPLATVIAVWMVWTFWHSWLFPLRRQRYLARSPRPYRAALARDIYPWVTIGFCQMWRPLLNGDTIGRLLDATFPPLAVTPAVLVGTAFGVISLVVMISAIRTIGIGNAAFVPEFSGTDTFVPIRQGLYRVFAHPLFWAGILFSVGLALVAGTPTARRIAAVNLAYGFVYNYLESRRLSHVFGERYRQYVSRVSGGRDTNTGRIPLRRAAGPLAGTDQEIPGTRAVHGERHEQ